MKKEDYHFQANNQYPWRIDLCLNEDGKIDFSGASPDLTVEDAIAQGKILINRFMAKKAILTPIIVDKRLTQEKIDLETRRLTTILEKEECLLYSKKPLKQEILSLLMSSLKRCFLTFSHNFLKRN